MISFIIPAHNEASSIAACIVAIQQAIQPTNEVHEIIVVDDASADATAEIARNKGAKVISVTHKHIAATRNAGAKAAQGDIFFFIDADTLINPRMLRNALTALKNGAVGGGGVPTFDRPLPLWFYFGYPIFWLIINLLRQPGGSSLFCTRNAYFKTGGFNETYYAAEDAIFVSSLKKQGRITLAGTVLTSGRKARTYSLWYFIKFLFVAGLGGVKSLRRRKGLDLWYDSKRE